MLVTIARFSMAFEAQIAKARLDSEGMPAFLADVHTNNALSIYGDAFGGIRLQVPEEVAERAVQILAEYQEQALCELDDDQGE
ncbi:putative signal transducing protein [Salinispirillum marinum]|uniref:Signal transducing protein n=2 Tax=Saccharospirillaceae TaxID=255527 RepID=A0ABV8BHS2_9GAMM